MFPALFHDSTPSQPPDPGTIEAAAIEESSWNMERVHLRNFVNVMVGENYALKSSRNHLIQQVSPMYWL